MSASNINITGLRARVALIAMAAASCDKDVMMATATQAATETGAVMPSADSTGDTAAPTTSGADSTTGSGDQTGDSGGVESTTEGISSGTSTGTTEPGATTTSESTSTTSDTTGSDTTTGPMLPGSCRPSESYGSAGRRPAFTDPAYAEFLDRQVAVTTTSAQSTPYVLHVVDISGPPPPPNVNYAAPRYERPEWTTAGLGQIYGVTLDSAGNIYVAATSVHGATQNPGTIKRIDAETGAITELVTLPNDGPSLGNINYDCVSETIYASNHEDGRIYQINLAGEVVSTYKHSTKDVTIGLPADPGEPDGVFVPLGERVWGVQSHAGRLYYSVWWEYTQLVNLDQNNEIWSVAYVDDSGVPDPATARRELVLPEYPRNPVADISFAQPGRMILGRRSMWGDMQTVTHESNVLGYDWVGGMWQPAEGVWTAGEFVNSAAGGVDHDFAANGRVWLTSDSLDMGSPDVVYGLQGAPLAGGYVNDSTIIDLDGDLTSHAETLLGDVEIPIPDDAMPVVPPG